MDNDQIVRPDKIELTDSNLVNQIEAVKKLKESDYWDRAQGEAKPFSYEQYKASRIHLVKDLEERFSAAEVETRYREAYESAASSISLADYLDRTGGFALMLAQKLSLSQKQAAQVAEAAVFHNIGLTGEEEGSESQNSVLIAKEMGATDPAVLNLISSSSDVFRFYQETVESAHMPQAASEKIKALIDPALAKNQMLSLIVLIYSMHLAQGQKEYEYGRRGAEIWLEKATFEAGLVESPDQVYQEVLKLQNIK